MSTLQSGWYLFRAEPDLPWHATFVADDGVAHAKWINEKGEAPIAKLNGEWHGPFESDDPLIQQAKEDVQWRLRTAVTPSDKATVMQ